MPIADRHPGRPVRGPARGTDARRRAVRSGDGRLVRRRSRVLGPHAGSCEDPHVLAAVNPVHARDSSSPPTAATASSCSARSSWSSPAARRSTPTWAISAGADPARLVRPGAAGAAAQLLRPGRAAAAHPEAARVIRSTCWRRAGRCYPLVVLATMAAIIASQALISGAFSLTRQAIQLGYCPRLDIGTRRRIRRARSTCRRSTGC